MPEEESLAADTMFEEAVDALRQGERARAKEILTRLLRTDQNNARYWVWMSAAVDTTKERIYCLETALKLDPQNTSAKRGLVLMGALEPDESLQPFPVNHPRAWEENLLLAHEKPQEQGLGAAMRSPVARLAGVALIGVLVCGIAYFGFFNPRSAQLLRGGPTHTPGPVGTFTLTPTFVNATGEAGTPQEGGPTPLAVLMGVSYTPTAVYVNTPRSPLSMDIYRSAKAALQQENWDEYIRQMEQIQKAEPEAPDIPYYIGEAYRAQGNCRAALNYYNESLQVDNTFAPGYLGLARARLCQDPGANISQLYDLAIQSDPKYGEAYLDRAGFYLARKDFKTAMPDLQMALQLMPDSALVQLAYSQAYLLQGDDAKALEAAQKANNIDKTLLPAYYYLGYAYSANHQYPDAIKPLEIYVIYDTENGSAYALLGEAYERTGNYKAATEALTNALQNDPNQVRSYLYLGISDLRLDDLDGAQTNLRKALEFYPDSFDANIALTEVMYRQGTFGNAYLQSEAAKSKATNDNQVALALYWRALSQEGRKDFASAAADWKALLDMPEDVMTPEMRQAAEDHLAKLVTATPTPKAGTPTRTPTPTKPSGSSTPTLTPTPTRTPMPTRTP